MEGDNVRRRYLANILPPNLQPLTKDVIFPSEYLLGDNLNERLENIKTNNQMLNKDSSHFPYKNSKNSHRFPKNPGNQSKGFFNNNNNNNHQRGYNKHQHQKHHGYHHKKRH